MPYDNGRNSLDNFVKKQGGSLANLGASPTYTGAPAMRGTPQTPYQNVNANPYQNAAPPPGYQPPMRPPVRPRPRPGMPQGMRPGMPQMSMRPSMQQLGAPRMQQNPNMMARQRIMQQRNSPARRPMPARPNMGQPMRQSIQNLGQRQPMMIPQPPNTMRGPTR